MITSLDYCSKPVLNGSLIADYDETWPEEQNCSLIQEDFIDGYETCKSTERILYGKFDFDSTIVTEFHLVCNEQYKVRSGYLPSQGRSELNTGYFVLFCFANRSPCRELSTW